MKGCSMVFSEQVRAHRVNKRHATRCGSFAPIEPGDPWASLVTPGLPREATLQ